jgi:hypothetical protein
MPHDRGFVEYWDVIKPKKIKYPDIGDPHNIHAFGVQPKNEGDIYIRTTFNSAPLTSQSRTPHPAHHFVRNHTPRGTAL